MLHEVVFVRERSEKRWGARIIQIKALFDVAIYNLVDFAYL